ncbi:MAG: DUF1631 family protein [Gammaproteobacteria bacterium]|nr:DUF1631 family protein [Gammaproteobacteria bacterium]
MDLNKKKNRSVDAQPQSHEPSGRERRAHERYALGLEARLSFRGMTGWRCAVRDFCVGGMSLALEYDVTKNVAGERLEGPGRGDIIDIECSAQSVGADNALNFSAQVVRRQGDGLAVRFLSPDLGALNILLNYAKSLSRQHSEHGGEVSLSGETFNGKSAAELIQNCHQMVTRSATNIMAGFLDEVGGYLFEVSKAARDITEQNACFDALKVLNNSRDSLRDGFLTTVKSRLAQYSPLSSPFGENTEDPVTANALSIVDDEVFDDWLADAATVDSVESRNREVLTEIERRLSLLYDAEIKRFNNPYGPSLFTHLFHETLKLLSLRHSVNLACYKAFRNVLLENLDGLYNRINQYFIDNDVMRVIEYSVLVREADALPQHAEAPPQKPAVEVEKPQTTEGAENVPGSGQDLYQLVGELKTLQQQLSQHFGKDAVTELVQGKKTVGELLESSGVSAEKADENTGDHLTREEVQAALGLVEPALNTVVDKNDIRDFKAEVLTVLDNHSDVGNKNMGIREARIIDVASNIFHGMTTDLQVSGKIRNWIEQLELPVIKIAVDDDSLFTDRTHLVRQVINKVAQLEMLVGESEKTDQPAVQKALDWIVSLVNEEFDGSTEVFSRAVHQLDVLLNVQDKTYRANLQNLIEKSDQEEHHLLRLNDASVLEPNLAWDDVSSEEKALWIKRATRLNEGDWVVMDADAPEPRRLRIAWKAPRTQRIVFSDALGAKALVLHVFELAEKLRAGSAVVPENANEPAMDRAQYSMLQGLHQQLLYQSTHDQLTGLVSRREFERCLSEIVSQAQENRSRHAVCFLDLDQFNVINNACGYEGGDRLLKDVAGLLSGQLTEGSTLARLGSDEFGLLLKSCALDDALDFVEELMETVQDYRLQWGNKRLSVGVSVGLVPVSHRSEAANELLQAAEASCGVAKEMGGNRIQLYSTGHAGLSRRRKAMKWAVEIDRILDEDTLYLRCQRIMPIDKNNAASGATKNHYEILLGIWDLNGGDISTPDFIEAAERYKRMPDVDRWVIKNAFQWIKKHHQSLVDSIDMFSINLSGRSLNDESFLVFLLEHIHASGVPVEKITFEVTETAGVANLSDAVGFIEAVKETGCLFALDDFGTGMSSYAYLKNLPVDYLKIDGAFVKDMASTPSDYAVVKSICEIGHFMGKKVIAEFVENDEILALLKELGVDYAQGYGIEKPRRLEDLVKGPSVD